VTETPIDFGVKWRVGQNISHLVYYLPFEYELSMYIGSGQFMQH